MQFLGFSSDFLGFSTDFLGFSSGFAPFLRVRGWDDTSFKPSEKLWKCFLVS